VPFAEVDGIRLHYADAGPRAEGAVARLAAPPALVLLHAFPLHSGMWTPQIEAFAADRRVIAPDLPGFGGSDAPDSMHRYTMAGFADLVAGLLDRLSLDRVVVGGLSMGGYVAFAFVRQHGERVAGLILADTRAAADTSQVFERRTDQQDQVARIGTTALIEVLLAGLPNARQVVIEGCGHGPSYTHPELVAEVVRQFLTPPAPTGDAPSSAGSPASEHGG